MFTCVLCLSLHAAANKYVIEHLLRVFVCSVRRSWPNFRVLTLCTLFTSKLLLYNIPATRHSCVLRHEPRHNGPHLSLQWMHLNENATQNYHGNPIQSDMRSAESVPDKQT